MERIKWIDYSRGIAIILVVYGHLLSSSFNANLNISKGFYQFSDSFIYSFHMPLFFFLSGLMVELSATKSGPKKFLLQRLSVLLYPYLIWSSIQVCVELIFAKHSHRGVAPMDLLSIPVIPCSHFWFLYALLLMNVVYCLSLYFKDYATHILLLIACTLFVFPIGSEVMALHGFSTEFIFFVAGIIWYRFLGVPTKALLSPRNLLLLVVLFSLYSWFLFEKYLGFVRLTTGDQPIFFALSALTGSAIIISVSMLLAEKKIFSFLQVVGRYSLQIYLVHMLAGVATRIILLKLFPGLYDYLVVLLSILAGVIIPLLLYKISGMLNLRFIFEISSLKRS